MPTLLDPNLSPTELFNGSCARCGTGSPLYDLDISVPYEGIVALCPGCIYDVGHAAGFLMTEQGADELKIAKETLVAYFARIQELESLINAIILSMEEARAGSTTHSLSKRSPSPGPKTVDGESTP
jgi:hypothetical protein